MDTPLALLASLANEFYFTDTFKVGSRIFTLRNLSVIEEGELDAIDMTKEQEFRRARVARGISAIDTLKFSDPGDEKRDEEVKQITKILGNYPHSVIERMYNAIQQLHTKSRKKIADENGIDLEKESQDKIDMMKKLSSFMEASSPDINIKSESQVSESEADQLRKEFQNFPGKDEMPVNAPVVSPEMLPPDLNAR